MQIALLRLWENAIRETERRRELQIKYNEEHDIVPKTVTKEVAEISGNFYSQGRRKEKEKEKTYRSRTQADDRTIDKRNEGSRQVA